MSGPPALNDPPRQIGVFELGWLRHTDSLADPVTRARSLCGEIARIVRADRVSLLSTGAAKPKLIATSSTVSPDPRSHEMLRLQKIASRVRDQAGDVWTDEHESINLDAEPECLDLLAIPIAISSGVDAGAVLVLQRYTPQPSSLSETLAPIRAPIEAAAASVAESGQLLSHALENRLLASWRAASSGRRAVLLTIAGLAVVMIAVLPVPFRLSVRGQLAPASARGVFSPAGGALRRLHVHDGASVRAGEQLAEISSVEIEMQHDRIAGELAAAETELATLRLNQSDSVSSQTSPAGNQSSEQSMRSSSARQMVLRARIESLTSQSELIHRVKQSLVIQAPLDGRVMLRDEQANLVGQNISQSQWLMQIVDPRAGYDAVMDLPEQDFGYLHDTIRASDSPLAADLRLRSSPHIAFSGTAINIANTVHWNEQGIAAIAVTFHVNDSLPENVHVGASVVGSISAGQRSLGFILFRPFIEWLRSYGW